MILKLTNGFETIIDDEDYHLIAGYNLGLHVLPRNRAKYARVYIPATENKKRETVGLHRIIMGITDSKISIDHIDHDGLNNRKSNLRICTHKQNARNTAARLNSTSKYLGVCLPTGKNRFVAQIRPEGNKIFLGNFINEIDAAMAYDKAALKYYGEYANLNFPI